MNLKIYSDTDLHARHISRSGPIYQTLTYIPMSNEILYASKYNWNYEPVQAHYYTPSYSTWTVKTDTGNYTYATPATHQYTIDYDAAVPLHTHQIQGYNTTYTYHDEVANVTNT